MADSISIEETNKIRVALGLKALPVPGGAPTFKEPSNGHEAAEEEDQGSTLESRQAAGYDNWKKIQDGAEAKAKRDARNEAIKRARDTSKRFAKLEGKGLGDVDDEVEVDTKTWLLRQKKRQRRVEKARKLEQELAEREGHVEYTAADLAGVKVAHELDDFEEGGDQVLTLKDTTIDENEEEGDELENLELKERDSLAEKTELKKKKPVYNPNDADDAQKSILGQYDEEIDGKKRKRFTLDGDRNVSDKAMRVEETTGKSKPKVFSLDLEVASAQASDYLDASEVKIRKPKKKKSKSTRQRAADEDDIIPVAQSVETTDQNGTLMDIDPVIPRATVKKRSLEDTSFADDDDLQASLALQRRNALKKRKKSRPEDIARQLREEASATPVSGETNGTADDPGEEGGLVIDETSEFVANLQKPTIPDRTHRSTSRPTNGVTAMAGSPADSDGEADADEQGDINMKQAYKDEEANENRVKREHSTPAAPDMTSTGLDDESTLSQGIGATLSMLTQRGLIKPGASTSDLNAQDRDRMHFLTEKQRREAEAEHRARLQRERDRASGKLERMSAREKEAYAQAENRAREQAESRQIAEVFSREYRPNVEIRYTDEYGRAMNQKEAFRHLSHQFHGKGSGKQKTEKRIKKIEDEKRREAMSSLDSSQSTGMNSAMGATARKQRTAGVRLG